MWTGVVSPVRTAKESTVSVTDLMSYAEGAFHSPSGSAADIASAVTGDVIARASSAGLDFRAMADHARGVGGPALRHLTFHDRALMLKALAQYLNERKEPLYELSFRTGATKADSMVDIDGGIGTLFVMSSKGRREMPNSDIYPDGGPEVLSRDGQFMGQHVYTSRQGVAIHINAFNFPVWGMLEKLAPAILAGMPAIIKPATATSYLTEATFRLIVESGILPQGSVQLIVGSTGDLLDHVTCQDIVSFTGSAETAEKLQTRPALIANATRFIAERDSLNASILGPDAVAGTPEFDLFVREVAKEMTVKAGQKCTAIRRAIVPRGQLDAVSEALTARLEKIQIGDPALEATRMGALASQAQRRDVYDKIALLAGECERVHGDPERLQVVGADAEKGAFVPAMLFRCADPIRAERVHEIEPFGPVSTLMPYDDADEAIAIANKGAGSLVASVFTHDPAHARAFVLGSAAFHGRLLFSDRDCGKQSTGHGSPMPHLVHGGPGRAGGGEELGGVRGVLHYMQRTALQGSPRTISAVLGRWHKGAPETDGTGTGGTETGGREIGEGLHPFRLTFQELEIGKTLNTEPREITLDDIEHFARFTGDTFYAHMDEAAAKANPFFPGRVAHGYLILSFAAGLFVDPAPGPVLANYGLDSLRFLKPVSPGDRIKVRLTAKEKNKRNADYGEVRWDVEVSNQDDEAVAQYELLTMNAMK